MTKKILSEDEAAARAVALQENIPARDRKELLDMLGLLDTEGAVTVPDEDSTKRGSAIPQVNGEYKGRGAIPSGERLLSDRSLVPAGLRKIPGQEK